MLLPFYFYASSCGKPQEFLLFVRDTALRLGVVLAIVGVCAVLAVVMLVEQELRHADIRAREAQAVDVRVRLSVLENARNSGSDRGSGILSDMERYEETLDWIERTIQAIRAEREWRVSSSGYFCRFICSVRDHCPIANEIIHSKERSHPE